MHTSKAHIRVHVVFFVDLVQNLPGITTNLLDGRDGLCHLALGFLPVFLLERLLPRIILDCQGLLLSIVVAVSVRVVRLGKQADFPRLRSLAELRDVLAASLGLGLEGCFRLLSTGCGVLRLAPSILNPPITFFDLPEVVVHQSTSKGLIVQVKFSHEQALREAFLFLCRLVLRKRRLGKKKIMCRYKV